MENVEECGKMEIERGKWGKMKKKENERRKMGNVRAEKKKSWGPGFITLSLPCVLSVK